MSLGEKEKCTVRGEHGIRGMYSEVLQYLNKKPGERIVLRYSGEHGIRGGGGTGIGGFTVYIYMKGILASIIIIINLR